MKEPASVPATEYEHIRRLPPEKPRRPHRWLWLLVCLAVFAVIGAAAARHLRRQAPAETAPAETPADEAIPETEIKTQLVRVELPFEIVWKETDELSAGQYGRERAGVPGECVMIYKTVLRGGEVVSRKLVTERIASSPVDEVRLIGTWPSEHTLTLEDGTLIRYTDMMICEATAYTYNVGRASITATGEQARVGLIAVDPTVIPYHTRMFIKSPSGKFIYGECVAEDCGGGVKGDRVDLFMETYDECIQFGRRPVEVYFLPDVTE